MKTIAFLILLLAVSVISLRADYFSPFGDSKVGSTVTSGGQFVVVERKEGGSDYFVRFRACAGPAELPAKIPSKLIRQGMAGRNAKITATIREREDAKTKSKSRCLEVTEIEYSN